MDVLFADVVTGEPVEVVPVINLVFEFGLAFFAIADPNSGTVPVNASVEDVTEGAILESLNGFAITFDGDVVNDLDAKIFSLARFIRFEETSDPWRIACDGFRRRRACQLDSGFEMERTETGGVARITKSSQSLSNFLVGFQAGRDLELVIDLVAVLLLELPKLCEARFSKASAAATNRVGPSVSIACPAAPVPRPPQPIKSKFNHVAAVGMRGRANGSCPPTSEPPATRADVVLMKWRRVSAVLGAQTMKRESFRKS